MIYNIPKEPAGPVWDCDGARQAIDAIAAQIAKGADND